MGNTLVNANGNASNMFTLGRNDKNTSYSPNQEGSRILFLLYLIHRTWNIVVDSVDSKKQKWSSNQSESGDSAKDVDCPEGNDDLNDESIFYGSEYSFCRCNYCYESFYSCSSLQMSVCESESSSVLIGYHMAPSASQNPPNTKNFSTKMMMDTSVSYPLHYTSKENQRPPVYNPEDYALSLKKFAKCYQCKNGKSIYDTNGNENDTIRDNYRAQTLPSTKSSSEYKNPMLHLPETDCEMSLRQFGSISDLLSKLRADLRASFPSFVQEFISSPLDGVSLLLEILRAIQLSQVISTNNTTALKPSMTSSMPRNTQVYQRRALLDELACLQCLCICCCRSPEAISRLGTTPVGLLPLTASATGQGIRARILALQLLTSACDRNSMTGTGSQKDIFPGHTAVSEALSTLRLRCGEPVRFRLLIGMLNSGGGSGELQAYGIKFLNAFLESAENLQNRLYLQAELYQAGFDTNNITKTISPTSPWLEKLRAEIKHFDEIKIDVEKLLVQAGESERIKSQMVILERRVQILQEEKSVLISMERRLQERCAELQREVFRLQGAQSENYKTLDKFPVAVPKHIPPTNKQNSLEHEDEGISSSETGQSLSPVPIHVFPQKSHTDGLSIILKENTNSKQYQEPDNVMLDVVFEKLKGIVNNNIDKKSSLNNIEKNLNKNETKETEIVPVNLLPQPPRKSKSLAHLISPEIGGSDLDASEYGLLLIHNNRTSYFDFDFETEEIVNDLNKHNECDPEQINNNLHNSNTNREILDAIMQSKETETDLTINALRAGSNEHAGTCTAPPSSSKPPSVPPPPPPPQHFNGVFFMTEMNTPQKYPKPDVAAALQAKRTYGVGTMVDIVLTSSNKLSNNQIYFGSSPTLKFSKSYNDMQLDHHLNNNVGITKHTSRTKSYTSSKVTDIPSGLY